MLALRVTALIFLASSCASIAQPANPAGCFRTRQQGPEQELADAVVTPVSAEAMARAVARLPETRVLELSRAEAVALLGSAPQLNGRYYLARAQIVGMPGEAMSDLIVRARQHTSYVIGWAPTTHAITLVTMQYFVGSGQANRIAVVIQATVPMEEQHLSCLIHD